MRYVVILNYSPACIDGWKTVFDAISSLAGTSGAVGWFAFVGGDVTT